MEYEIFDDEVDVPDDEDQADEDDDEEDDDDDDNEKEVWDEDDDADDNQSVDSRCSSTRSYGGMANVLNPPAKRKTHLEDLQYHGIPQFDHRGKSEASIDPGTKSTYALYRPKDSNVDVRHMRFEDATTRHESLVSYLNAVDV